MDKLLNYLEEAPGPFAVGLMTHSEESNDDTAGSFCVICDRYKINNDRDCVIFVQGEEGLETAEVVIPLEPLEFVTDEEGILVYLNYNLTVAVEGFTPQVLVHIKRLS